MIVVGRPVRCLAAVGLVAATTGPLPAQARSQPLDGPPAPVVPPASLAASSTVPTQIVLSWPAVDGAGGYRVTRSSSDGEAEVTIAEGAAAAFARERGMCRGSQRCWYPNRPVALTPRYAYRVYSIFPGPVYSAASPVATAMSAPYVAPANLTHAVAPSTLKPGYLQVTVSWLPVSGADGYAVVPTTGGVSATTVRTASVRFDPLSPKTTYGLCVSTIYQLNVRDDAVRSCLTLVL